MFNVLPHLLLSAEFLAAMMVTAHTALARTHSWTEFADHEVPTVPIYVHYDNHGGTNRLIGMTRLQ